MSAIMVRFSVACSLLAPVSGDLQAIVDAFAGDEEMLWGSATASYQVEGAWDRDGRQPTIWDDWFHSGGHWDKYHNNHDNGDVADDFYDLWPEDIARIRELKFNAFRISIAWSRVLPYDKPNDAGKYFYTELLRSINANGISPLVTLYHWDLPNDKDWEDPKIVDQFVAYADYAFEHFGPFVKHWLTFNEPWVFCGQGYGGDGTPPARNSRRAKYVCGHHVLLAHARVVKLYKEKYQAAQQGKIGITLNYDWSEPYDPSNPDDIAAAQLNHDFNLGWFADPVYLTGDYPDSMRQMLGNDLPTFTEEESSMLLGSYDFWGQNHYTTTWARPLPGAVPPVNSSKYRDDGTPIGKQGQSEWLMMVPWGIEKLLLYVHQRYTSVREILITENGVDLLGENEIPFPDVLNDTERVQNYENYLTHVASAKMKGVPVKGYFAWSLLDNLEWNDGFDMRFGLHYVDFKSSPPKRYPKASAKWFKSLFEQLESGLSEADLLV